MKDPKTLQLRPMQLIQLFGPPRAPRNQSTQREWLPTVGKRTYRIRGGPEHDDDAAYRAFWYGDAPQTFTIKGAKPEALLAHLAKRFQNRAWLPSLACFDRAHEALKADDHRAAIEAFEQVLALYPEDERLQDTATVSEAYLGLAEVYSLQDETDQASHFARLAAEGFEEVEDEAHTAHARTILAKMTRR